MLPCQNIDLHIILGRSVDVISKMIFSGIGALKRVRGLIDRKTAIKGCMHAMAMCL